MKHETLYKCDVCGKEVGEIIECHKCEKHICLNCEDSEKINKVGNPTAYFCTECSAKFDHILEEEGFK